MPHIAKDFIDRIQDDVSLEAVIRDFVELKKAGANLTGLSPFVDEKTPSFMVSPSKQIWKCFSSGKGGNSAISFLMEKGFTYPDAIHYIAKKLGRDVQYDDTDEAKAYAETVKKKEALRPLLKAAIKQYQQQYAQLSDDHPAKKEVARRGYDQEVVDTYQIGFAPGNYFIYNILKEKGLVEDGKKINLITDKNKDFYFDRVTYTVFDANGNPISMVGRSLNPDDKKYKWLNSSNTELYEKDNTWYGLHLAKTHMRQTGKAYVVEGYNDVIAFQRYGLLNTVAGCGTNITDSQIRALKRYADIVELCMDGDAAGRKAAAKAIPRFLEMGFRCYVLNLKDSDPDDFVRLYIDEIEKDGLASVLETKANSVDAFKILLDELKDLDEVSRAVKAKELCELISKISDDSITEIYSGWLQKESKLTATVIKNWIKEFIAERDRIASEKAVKDNEYQLPKGIAMTEGRLEDIKRYFLFQEHKQIWMQRGSDPPYTFKSVSNFCLDIIQHMQDEERPKKLVAVKNVHNEGYVFDVPSDTFNDSKKFMNAMTNFGNFRWHGRGDDLQKLQAFLFDKMGNGRSIDVLGWQKEGFYLFNNLVVVPGKPDIIIDDNGCFRFKGTSYYVPSANQVYKDNVFKYGPQKRFRHHPGSINPTDYFNKLIRVHGQTAITGILFTIASLFHDVVGTKLKGFPIMFLYGPPGTGKDELNYCLQSFWGDPQEGTNLEGGNSTATANIRELAQFNNSLMQWSEYARGDHKLDGTIKSLWDLRGKKIGTITSRVSTDNVPILCGISLTGNEYPDNPAIITRVIWNDMDKIDFNDEDELAFNDLADITDEGITHITVQILHKRDAVEEQFTKHYRLFMDIYQSRIPDCNKRMLKNIATLSAFYEILKDELSFPFTQNEMMVHFQKLTENQMRKLTSSSLIMRWWDCFLASMRGMRGDRIEVGQDIKLEGRFLYFQYTHCFNKIQRQWNTQYRDVAPAKSTMIESLRKDSSYVNNEASVRFSVGREAPRSSAEVVDILKLPGGLDDLLKAEVERQEYEMNTNPFSPAPPKNGVDNGKSEKSEENDLKLPF